MGGKRQNNQLRLAFGEETRSEASQASGEGSETLTAKRISESPANNEAYGAGRSGTVQRSPHPSRALVVNPAVAR